MAEGKNLKQKLIGMSRRVVKIIYRILKNQTEYEIIETTERVGIYE